jgi:general secretion pathway protein D
MKQLLKLVLCNMCFLSLVGCETARLHDEGLHLVQSGKIEQGLGMMELAVERAPSNPVYRADYLSQRDSQVANLLAAGNIQLASKHWQEAGDLYERARAIFPVDPRPQDALLELGRAKALSVELEQVRADIRHNDVDRARSVLNRILSKDPDNQGASLLLRQIDQARAQDRSDNPVIQTAPGKAVSLHFNDASVRMILDAIGHSSGLSIILDQDIRRDLLTSISVDKVPVEDAINYVMQTNHLRSKVLDANTLLIYPGTPEKIRDYEDLLVRGFYLANADAKRTEALLKGLLKADQIFVDEKSNLLIVRGPIDQIRLAEKLVAMQDVEQPEVMLEVRVMEVNRSTVTDLGVMYPNQAALSRTPSSGGGTTLADYLHINPSVISMLIPSTVVNLSRVLTDADLLANPRVRVRNREHAKILIGEKLPIVTSTATSTGFVSENIQYIDVGLKLDVEPNISLDGVVSINLNLEVSSVTKQVTTPGGSLAYQLGTRDATTVLELRDGETEVLAGLISDDDTRTATNIPGLGDLPILGRLFSNHNTDHEKNEVILAITPHIVRGYRPSVADDSQFWSGTASRPRTEPFVLHQMASTAPSSVDTATPTQSVADLPAAAKSLSLSWRGPSQVKPGAVFTVAVHMTTDGSVHALPTQLSYDPSALEVTQVQEGGFFKAEGSQSLFASSVDASAGKIIISAGRSGVEGAAGDSDIAIITLKARAAGQSAKISVIAAPVLADGQSLKPSLPDPFTVVIRE